MIGGSALDTVLGSRPAGNKENLTDYVRALARVGLAVVLVEPNGKNPIDMRSRPQRAKDDKAAQLAAQAAGNPRWGAVTSQSGIYLATTDTTLLDRYMKAAATRYGVDAVNLGVEVGRSRLLVVDCDTGPEVARFQQDMMDSGQGFMAPTVSTPGRFDGTTWVHKDGGHFWFTIPEGYELPPGGMAAYKPGGPNGWQAYWGDRQLLIPPSTRAEGPYRWNGGARPVPDWLWATLIEQTNVRKAKAAQRIDSLGDSPIDSWSAQTSWAQLLEPAGWTYTGKVSNCGCPEWTAPGMHDNPKSATAHDLGCADDRYDGMNGHAPLHIWTDNPPAELGAYVRATGSRTLSKLQFSAWTYHGGDQGQACSTLGIAQTQSVVDPWNGQAPALAAFSSADFVLRDQLLAERAQAADAASFDFVEDDAAPFDEDPVDLRTDLQKWFDDHAGGVAKFRDLPPVEHLIDGYLDTNSFSMLIGPRGTGKSFVALDMAAAIATGRPWQGHDVRRGRVAYMVGEGLHGFMDRVRTWERVHDTDLDAEGVFIIDMPIQVADAAMWNGLAWWCLNNNITTLVLDTLNRISVGIDENSAQDMGRVVDAMRQVQDFAQCHILLVHHTTMGTDRARGSSALEGAADTVLLVEQLKLDTGGTGIGVSCTKMKNHAEPEPAQFSLKIDGASCVLAQVDGSLRTSTDPFGVVPQPEVDGEQRITHVAELVAGTAPELGLTRAQIIKLADPAKLSNRALSKLHKERLVTLAVDQAVSQGYLEGAELASGGVSTSRFVPGPACVAVPVA